MAAQRELIQPAFPGCDHCLIFCADDGYMALTAVTIQSIAEQAAPDQQYDILMLHGGVSQMHQHIYETQWADLPNLSVRLVDVSPYFDGLSLFTANRQNFTREAYFRLITPWILDPAYKTALYLDGDMIARRDISPVFDTPLEGKLLAAVKDYWGICNCYIPDDPRRAYRESIGLTDIDHYVISATLLFNLALFRERFTLEQVVELCASRNWEQHDQDVVNVLCQGEMVYLPPTWGMMEDYGNNCWLPAYMLAELAEYEQDPVIAHFGGLRKPYATTYRNFDIEFWTYADHTPYMHLLFGKIKSVEYKNYVASLVNPDGIERYVTENSDVRLYKGVSLGRLNQGHLRYRVLRIQGQTLHLEGMVGYFGISHDTDVHVQLSVNDTLLEPVNEYPESGMFKRMTKKVRDVYLGRAFVFDVPLDPEQAPYTLKLVCTVNGTAYTRTNLGFRQYAELTGRFRSDYYTHNGWTVKTNKKMLFVTHNQRFDTFRNERAFLKEQWKSNGVMGKKAVVLRPMALLLRRVLRRPVWLISDRLQGADDSGEVFYRYMKEHHRRDVRSYFLLSSSSPDAARLRPLGGLVSPYSWKHKLLSLVAEWSISSQTDYVFRDPFMDYGHCYRNLLRKTRFVFLQHGVISNDLSEWLDKDVQELDGFITSTPREFQSILDGKYHYTDEQVWMTGLPRFDRLQDKREKLVTVMPTWRKYLTVGQNHETGKWNLKNGFAESDYVRCYRELMNHPRLQQRAQELGYTLQFKIHPTCMAEADAFRFNERVQLVPANTSYAELYSRSSLIVTDYSSSIYDFVYLRKPVMYYQFDADMFFSGAHSYEKGDFEYERDGFGEVTYRLEDAVDAIIRYMETDCALHAPYDKRIEDTFPNRSQNHCELLYQKIKSKGRY